MKRNRTTLIYLIGRPGTGKYTISQELSKFGFLICDNQLINNPILTLVNYDGFSPVSRTAWNAIGKIRDIIFNFLEEKQTESYVLTNVLEENEGDRRLYRQVEEMAKKRGSLFVPVKLLISEEEHLKRVVEPSRRERWKSRDPQEVYSKEALLKIEHPHLLEMDVSLLPAAQAAEKILDHVSKLKDA
jgi:dephospho-CoA kinase